MRRAPAPEAAISWDAALAWRTRRQGLVQRAPRGRLLDVAAAICGVHAQLMSSAELTLWARVDGLAGGDVEAELWEHRRLVKTWAMRGTLHLLPAAELGLWVGAQGALPARHGSASWLRHNGITSEQAEALLAAVPRALSGRRLTRAELAAEVARLTGEPGVEGPLSDGFGALLKPVAFAGGLAFAPSAGRNVRFAHPADVVDGFAPADPDEAIAAVTRRYLAAYGPATREELARWFGSPSPAKAGRWIAALGEEVAPVELGGRTAWMPRADVDEALAAEPAGAVRLLPAFDQYVVTAPRDADAVLAESLRPRVYRPQGWLSPVVAVDGRIAGLWSHEAASGRLRVRVEAFAEPGAALRAGVEREAARLAAFLRGDLDIAWGEVALGRAATRGR